MAISTNNYRQPQVQLTNEDRQFVELINNRITIYGQIPYTVPERLIIEIIKETALKFFRFGYWRAQQVCFYRLAVSDIVDFLNNSWQCPTHQNDQLYPDCQNHNGHYSQAHDVQKHFGHHIHPEQVNPTYKNLRGYAIKLPSYVNVVREIWESNKKSEAAFSEVVESVATDVFRQQTSPYEYSLLGINSYLYQYEVCAKMQQQAAFQATMGTSVPFRFNSANKTLIINKKISEETVSLMLQCDCNVDVQHLYIDDMFIDYVIGRTKIELRRLLGSHTIQLPGDVTLNVDELCYGAQETVDKIEEQLKGATGVGDIILQR